MDRFQKLLLQRTSLCLARAQIQYLISLLIVHFGGMILRIGFIKIIQKRRRKRKHNFYISIILANIILVSVILTTVILASVIFANTILANIILISIILARAILLSSATFKH